MLRTLLSRYAVVLLPIAALAEAPLTNVVKTAQTAVDSNRAMEVMRDVWSTDRWFTFPKFEETAVYLRRRLVDAGLRDVVVTGAPADGKSKAGFWTMPLAWDVKSARLEMIEPEQLVLGDYKEVPASVCMWSGPTPPGGLTAEVIALNPKDWPSVKGKLVLTDRNPADSKWLLVKHGAAGAINGFSENPKLDNDRQWINAWGDKGWAFNAGDTPLPCFSITPKHAAHIRDLLNRGQRVRVKASIDSRYYAGRYPYVTGVIPGSTNEEVLTLGHVAEQGAHDNATGVAAMVEALTALNKLIQSGRLAKPRRGIRILAMPEMYGSMHYIVSNPDRVRRTVAALCVDTPAAPYELAGTEYTFYMNPHVAASYVDALILRVAQEHLSSLQPPRPWHWKEMMAGTDSFLGEPTIGVPTVWPYSGTGVHTHHNSADTPDTVDARSLRDLSVITAAYLYFIANAGEPEVRWLAEITADRALQEIERGGPDRAGYNAQRGRDAIRSVLRLASGASAAVSAQLARLPEPRAVDPAPDTEAVKIVVRRKRPGTIPLDDLPRDRWEGFPSGAWAKTPITALYWCDGKRKLAEVIRLTRLETGDTKFDFVGYFRFLEKHGYVEFAK
jgi:hypothetical protein